MIRRASSASSACTAIRTSPSALTVSGNIDCGDRRRTRSTARRGLEQAADDAGLDVGVGAEDDDQVAHDAHAVTVMPRISALDGDGRAGDGSSSIFSRIIVMSSCCGASPTNAATSRSIALAQLVGRQVRVLLDQLRRAAPRRSSRPGRSSPR